MELGVASWGCRPCYNLKNPYYYIEKVYIHPIIILPPLHIYSPPPLRKNSDSAPGYISINIYFSRQQ